VAEKMKYRVIKNQGDLTIVIENGNMLQIPQYWVEYGTTEKEIVQDALNWLVAPAPDNWEHDEALFSERFDD
jgi:hypothetical protein